MSFVILPAAGVDFTVRPSHLALPVLVVFHPAAITHTPMEVKISEHALPMKLAMKPLSDIHGPTGIREGTLLIPRSHLHMSSCETAKQCRKTSTVSPCIYCCFMLLCVCI